ncbi:hypothetical protein RE628_15210 [Paenibacillus sp. D2_2]|uniref:hypothetical protein n=1 Tax=Paenibacillus sp. D2_2 TaxID=3073092 RepID=UPI0028160D38|nr:hypothetical protein [Paenibacillus sp. D2_2]WMT38889.1 hypothetical protein RE628_15210 [Paenibacillus sp. D2_2]
MLSDLERKVLRIQYNFSSQRRRMPTKPELERDNTRISRPLWMCLYSSIYLLARQSKTGYHYDP